MQRDSAEESIRLLELQRRWAREGANYSRIIDFRAQNLRMGTVLSALVGCVEDFVTAVGLETDGSTPSELRSWPSRKKFFEKEIKYRLTDIAEWGEFWGFVQARNAFVHGGGRLTADQRGWNSDRSVTEALALAGLTLDQGEILLRLEDLDRCWICCRSLVVQLDRAVPYVVLTYLPGLQN